MDNTAFLDRLFPHAPKVLIVRKFLGSDTGKKAMTTEEKEIGEFLVARGGPFYELQKRLRLLHEDAQRSGKRAAIFVGLAWGVPLVLSLVAGDAFGPFADKPYLLAPAAWARFFIAVGLFILMERHVEERLRIHLKQFAQAPLLAPGSFEPAAAAVTRALKRRDAPLSEAVCLLVAVGLAVLSAINMQDANASSWAVHVSADGSSLTAAAWWCVVVSSPIFWFLLFRWLWRLVVWAMLLRDIAGLELRLVATHPDGNAGLAFIGQYPNAYATFVFAMSCVLAAGIAEQLLSGGLAPATYGCVMAGWLLIVLALMAFPLQAFAKPLSDLRERTLLTCSSQATRHHRAAERALLGRNLSAAGDAEPTPVGDIPDPSKEFAAARKLSTFVFSRKALLPVSAAALLPLMVAGATQLPLKELFKVMKRLLLF